MNVFEQWYQRYIVKGWKEQMHEWFIGAWTLEQKKQKKVGEVNECNCNV